MQLAGELSKMNLASLIRLVRNSELTGKICLTQGVNSAFIFFENGQPIHVESDQGVGREALLELFVWQNGAFSYIECSVKDQARTLSPNEPMEALLKEGIEYQQALKYLEQLRVNARTVFKATVLDANDRFLSAMDGKRSLGELVRAIGLSRSQYVRQLQRLISGGRVVVVEAPAVQGEIQLPDWVISRLKQDNPDVSQSIVELVIWADRIKCWLYQADVDLMRVIQAIDPTMLSGEIEATDASGSALQSELPVERSFRPDDEGLEGDSGLESPPEAEFDAEFPVQQESTGETAMSTSQSELARASMQSTAASLSSSELSAQSSQHQASQSKQGPSQQSRTPKVARPPSYEF